MKRAIDGFRSQQPITNLEKQALLTLSQIKEDKSSFRNVTITNAIVKKVCKTIAVTTGFCKGATVLMKGQLWSLEKLSLASMDIGVMP